MSPLVTTMVVSGIVLAIIFASDLGRREVTAMRLARPLVVVGAVLVVFVGSVPHEGNDLALQLTGAGLGVILGLVAGAMLPAHAEPSGKVFTIAGWAYALFWVAVTAARILFVYGAEHWFLKAIIEFCVNYRISGPDVFSNAFVFLALTMVLARTGVVMHARIRLRRAAAGQAVPNTSIPN
ncbi:hypothetical protein GCM10010191_54680 [Actinomadura vinacea]|uniref:Integral membrane protein n=1 Tax=Actinomadura vinacea TaxID=115336 RepID=A0ABN3JNT4_9ACTN